jgi:hypothetical protein
MRWRRLRAPTPSFAPLPLVADGHAGAGESTFAGRPAAALGGTPGEPTDAMPTFWLLQEKRTM